MDNLLKYRETDYFNDKDYFLVVTNFKRFYVTQMHFYNGAWYTNEGCKYKGTSIRTINCNELYHLEVYYRETELKGIITKYINPDGLGVLWHQGQGAAFKKYGFPMFWNQGENLLTNKE